MRAANDLFEWSYPKEKTLHVDSIAAVSNAFLFVRWKNRPVNGFSGWRG